MGRSGKVKRPHETYLMAKDEKMVSPGPHPLQRSLLGLMAGITLVGSSLMGVGSITRTQAQTSYYCHFSEAAIAEKDALRQAAQQGDREAQQRYKTLVGEHAAMLRRCRSQTWPQTQAVWVRLYPCDIQSGALDHLLDRLVNLGYNQVYVEAFYNGQVLLPMAENQTPWPSVIRHPDHRNTDLLAEAIAKGRERGLEVYAWMFSMNFGYSYAQRPDRAQALAQNGHGQTSLSAFEAASLDFNTGGLHGEEAFVDPYNQQAKYDYYQMAEAILRRQPDGVLFDYIRYPKGIGGASVASRVQDLWIYGEAAQQALIERGTNASGQALIRRFLSRGYVTAGDLEEIRGRYGDEAPMWQGRSPADEDAERTAEETRDWFQQELWRLSVAHAIQGVLDFLAVALLPAQQQRIPAGAVFFPEANAQVREGYDSRLQPWDRFPASIEWHPMSYGVCGDTSCIVSKVQRVIEQAPAGTQIKPVIAGVWGQPITNRPSLEAQMEAIRRAAPQINAVSHFAYSWQDPQFERQRQFCQL